ncbi:MAG: flagellar basal body-associated FliL family protein [Betaproteobacteria bacterium]|nr:flagellar basal body-associated FliL family protein [Betaproteobacteria bacterium]
MQRKVESSKAAAGAVRAAAAEAAPPAPPVGKHKSKLLVILLVGLLTTVTTAGAWFGGLRNHPAFAFEKKSGPASADRKKQMFVPLEPFTVNLQDPDRERFLQLSLVLEANDSNGADGIKQKLPIIRSQILLLLSSKTSAELQGADAKNKLAREILVSARRPLDSDAADKGVEQVHFAQFIIQ